MGVKRKNTDTDSDSSPTAKRTKAGDARRLAEYLSVAVTGAEEGDVLRGITPRNRDACVVVRGGGIAAASGAREALLATRDPNDLSTPYAMAVDKMAEIPRFRAPGAAAAALEAPGRDTKSATSYPMKHDVTVSFLSLGTAAANGTDQRFFDPAVFPEGAAEQLLSGAPVTFGKIADDVLARIGGTILIYEASDWCVDASMVAVPTASQAFADADADIQRRARDDPKLDTRVRDVTTGHDWDGDRAGPGVVFTVFPTASRDHVVRLWATPLADGVQLRTGARELFCQLVPSTGDAAVDVALFDATDAFGSGILKSGIQKIIRFRPERVADIVPGHELDASIVLAALCVRLAQHPGCFVPDLGIYTTGVHALAKRLLVICFEDAFIPADQTHRGAMLAAGALLTRRVPAWRPSVDTLRAWILVAVDALASPRVFNYTLHPAATSAAAMTERFVLGDARTTDGPLAFASAVLDNVRSFRGDEALLRDIANFHGDENLARRLRQYPDDARDHVREVHARGAERLCPAGSRKRRPAVMPFAHAVDQHWLPAVAYLVHPDVVATQYPPRIASKPYGTLMNALFAEVTGVNPRRADVAGIEDRAFVATVRKAQQTALRLRFGPALPPHATTGAEEKRSFAYTIDASWIAGMLGPITVSAKFEKKKFSAYVFLTTEPARLAAGGPLMFTAESMPTARANKQAPAVNLTEGQKEAAITRAISMLESGGLPLDKAIAPVPALCTTPKPLLVVVRGISDDDGPDDFALRVRLSEFSEPVSICSLLSGTQSLPEVRVADYPSGGLTDTYLESTHASCVATVGADARVKSALATVTSASLLRRTIALLQLVTPAGRVHLPEPSRDGGTQVGKAAVTNDMGSILCLVSHLAYNFPAALSPVSHSIGVYRVLSRPVLWHVTGLLSAALATLSAQDRVTRVWPEAARPSDRQPRVAQTVVLRDLARRTQQGIRASFLWMTVGLGKTLIASHFARALVDADAAGLDHIIFMTPKSAMNNIEDQLRRDGYDVRRMVNTASEDKLDPCETNTPQPYTVTLVAHDMLRRAITPHESVVSRLVDVADRAVVIVDEVHAVFPSGTQRTAAASALASSAAYMLAMTGTPITSGKPAAMIPWLRRIVAFDVNPQNFWVAVSAMQTAVLNTDIRRVSEVAIAPDEDMPAGYRDLLPPKFGGVFAGATNQDMYKALTMSRSVGAALLARRVAEYVALPPLEGGIARAAMVVVASQDDRVAMRDAIVAAGTLDESQVVLLSAGDAVTDITSENVEAGVVPASCRVVIVARSFSTGYNLTHCNAMFTGVYWGNQGNREQLRGRIDRITQRAPELLYVTVAAGVLAYTLRYHNLAAQLQAAMQNMATRV